LAVGGDRLGVLENRMVRRLLALRRKAKRLKTLWIIRPFICIHRKISLQRPIQRGDGQGI
jgi:hypothetical protein